MINKHAKSKGTKLACFSVEEHVSIQAPKRLRGSGIKRLPCIVLAKSEQNGQKRYKLMCQYGILNGTFTASDLAKFPGNVTGKGDTKITLHAACLKFFGKDHTFCRCTTACRTKICKCFLNDLPCTSKCHKGNNEKCLNTKSTINYNGTLLPRYGGRYGANNSIYKFCNTCPLDTWFSILKFVDKDTLSQCLGENFKKILERIENNDFDGARMITAHINSITPGIDNSVSFYESEFRLFISPFLIENFDSVKSTECDGASCPKRNDIVYDHECPVVMSGESIQQAIQNWFTNESVGKCGANVGGPINDTFPSTNTITG